MILINNISKNYAKHKVLNGIDLQIKRGKITTLIGGNGAGKSTLLGIISRIIDADNGTIIINDKNIKDYKNRILAQHLSILKQSNNVTLKITVRELISFGRFPYSQGRLTKQDISVIDEAIHYLNLNDLQNSYVDELSGGQKQRVFLAMVVAQDTEYILLDEPLNNLDMKHSVQIMKILKKLCIEKGKTIIMVLHDINFTANYSDYIATIKNGKVIHFDTTKNIINPKKLKEVFDIDFEIISDNHNLICNYYN